MTTFQKQNMMKNTKQVKETPKSEKSLNSHSLLKNYFKTLIYIVSHDIFMNFDFLFLLGIEACIPWQKMFWSKFCRHMMMIANLGHTLETVSVKGRNYKFMTKLISQFCQESSATISSIQNFNIFWVFTS